MEEEPARGPDVSDNIGVVIIGRNEGERLLNCIQSLQSDCNKLVYVDSNSTDGSVEAARKLGVEVVELDMSVRFTAARARNAGYKHLTTLYPALEYVQFVDGDCRVDKNWIETAEHFLRVNPDFVVACGRRREIFPDRSIYNKLCDFEWNTPVGEAKACGGDFMIAVKAFDQVGGFNPSLIAGEEPELCIRLRRQGYKIMRLDAEMTLHDANITKFGQWWKRNVRAGFAFAEGAYLYGRDTEKYRVQEVRRIWIWALLLPLCLLVLSVLHPVFALGFLLYPLQVFRLAFRQGKDRFAWQYAFFNLLGKFPELQGSLRFWAGILFRAKSGIIEYK